MNEPHTPEREEVERGLTKLPETKSCSVRPHPFAASVDAADIIALVVESVRSQHKCDRAGSAIDIFRNPW